jgi:malonyl-CoA O-methyltransferase
MNDKPGALRPKDVQRRFERAARQFDESDFVQRHAANGLFERMSPMQLDAAHVLNLGSATGRDRKTLARRFRGAMIIGIDRSPSMLARAKHGRSWFSKSHDILATAERLPIAGGSIDVVYANLLLPWIDEQQACFAEVGRVLRKDGLFAFSTLGPDSFRELREAWDVESWPVHVRDFPDMHDVGDALIRSGLRDPVLDVDSLVLQYTDADKLFLDLRRSAAGNSLRQRQQSLTGKTRIRRFRDRLTDSGKKRVLSVSLELVYGHAWGSGAPLAEGEFHIAAGAIRRRRH